MASSWVGKERDSWVAYAESITQELRERERERERDREREREREKTHLCIARARPAHKWVDELFIIAHELDGP